MERKYLQDENIKFHFQQNKDDFVVDEVPRDFCGRGRYMIVHVKKTNLSTWDMIDVFANFLDIKSGEIGYAGLKDKYATTTQYISIESKYEKTLSRFRHSKIKILDITKDKYPIKMGDLLGNRFGIKLYDVSQKTYEKIIKKASKIANQGMPNYFGYQRFGKNQDSIIQAKQMIKQEIFIKDKKIRKFLISIYQSELFNRWLCKRVELSKQDNKFLLLDGDVYMDKKGKLFTPKEIPWQDFKKQKIVPTGLLCGTKVYRARKKAREIEAKYDDEFLHAKGSRREAIVFVKDLKFDYKKDKNILDISFFLPKGAYATVFLEAIANKNFNH